MLHTFLLSVNLINATITDSVVTNKPILQDSLKEDIVISAIRADKLTPSSQFNFNKKDIAEKNTGQDLTYILQSSPSIVAQSDAGNGFGYSYIRMRGMDQTRINFNINGVPVNDAETQGFFTNNFADLASSAQSIQVQRGVGTTGNGTAAFAGSIGLVTNDLRAPTSFNFTAGYGSFNSRRITAEYNTGMLYNRFAFYGRLSSLASDGYRNNSTTDLKTFFVSGGYFGKKSILKFNVFGGNTQSQLAFLPTEKSVLDTNRVFNQFKSFEKDQFQQNFNQIQYTYLINKNWNIAASAYYVQGNAPAFLMQFPQTFYYANMPDVNGSILGANMLNNYRLKQDFYGGMVFLNYENDKLKLNFGAHANRFKSDRFLEIPWSAILPPTIQPNHLVYSNTGYKNEISAFVKASYAFNQNLILFTELQLRNASFANTARQNEVFQDTFKVENMNWTFLNPKIGLRYTVNQNVSFYGSAGYITREPTRTDYLLSLDFATENITQNMVNPEELLNVEIGTAIATKNFKLDANLYLMEFRNEIAATGQLNIFGYSYRKNVATSFRRGIEISSVWQFVSGWSLVNNSAFSFNKISEFTQTFAVDSAGTQLQAEARSFKNVSPILTPNVVVNQGLRYELSNWLYAQIMGRYVSKSYLDNTNNENLTTPDYLFADLNVTMNLKKWITIGDYSLSFQLNNITNTLYSPAGTASNTLSKDANGLYSNTARASYFPAATRNFFVTLNIKF